MDYFFDQFHIIYRVCKELRRLSIRCYNANINEAYYVFVKNLILLIKNNSVSHSLTLILYCVYIDNNDIIKLQRILDSEERVVRVKLTLNYGGFHID